jgi:hypothetical protein
MLYFVQKQSLSFSHCFNLKRCANQHLCAYLASLVISRIGEREREREKCVFLCVDQFLLQAERQWEIQLAMRSMNWP